MRTGPPAESSTSLIRSCCWFQFDGSQLSLSTRASSSCRLVPVFVNVITKTGTNRHELLARVERDSWLPSNWNQQQDRMSEVELSAGGPVLIDRLYYFTANNFIVTDTRWWQDFDHFFKSPVSRELTGFSKLEYVPFPPWRLDVQGVYPLRGGGGTKGGRQLPAVSI